MGDEKSDRKSKSPKNRSTRKQPSRSEFDFINLIKTRSRKYDDPTTRLDSSLITHHSSLLKGIGDDAALLRPSSGRDLVITTDLLIEDVDFRREWISARMLGQKALAVSLSDIAAMGAQPKFALLSIGIPRDIWKTKFVDDFYRGFLELADEHQVTLMGGDISRAPKHVVIDSILTGEVKKGRAVLRSGAKPGDHLFVTGCLGGAAAGLKLLEEGACLNRRKTRSRRADAEQNLLLRQLNPEARVAWGAMLGEKRLASAMIDISDGLSSDLTHLCEESGFGARIDIARIPIDPNIAHIGKEDFDPLTLALNGGEDFELLFTVSPRDLKRITAEFGHVVATCIGEVSSQKSVELINGSISAPLTPAGYKHF